MTKDSDFKALVRERMNKTGESYAAARASLRRDAPASPGEPRRFEIPTWPMTGIVSTLRDSSADDGIERYVEVTADVIEVHDGAGNDFSLPRAAVVEARVCAGIPNVIRGLIGNTDTHLLYGGGGTVAAIRLAEPVDVRLGGSDVQLRELRVGVDDAPGLVAALSPTS
jgi:hypothetical protein